MITLAQYGILIILSVFWVFHLLVLLKIIPYSMVWGGRFKSDKEMYFFELFSILIISFLLFIILVHSNMLPISFSENFFSVILWAMTVFFALNTLGNFLSKNKFEQRIFSPITFILMILSLILSIG